jgi:indole-3-glycerol phosphate synthase
MNTLTLICADKMEHIRTNMRVNPVDKIERLARNNNPPRGFRNAILNRVDAAQPALIGEIKKASPSGGLIRPDFDPATLAQTYETAGAACLSVLTDTPYFQGKDEDLIAARDACALPVLRKDFMLDPYQIVESRALGADCILLIMAALSDTQAKELYDTAREYGMDVLVEVHDEPELDRALTLNADMIGINSRNLKTLEVNLGTALTLANRLPSTVTRIAESGIKTNADLKRLQSAGFQAFLVGESLMRHPDLTTAVRNLLGTF